MGYKLGVIADVHFAVGTDQYYFAIDQQYRQTSTARVRLDEFASDMEVEQADACIQTGDLIDYISNDKYSDLSDAIASIEQFTNGSFWHTLGNHEMSNDLWVSDVSDMWSALDVAANAGARENEWNPESDITGPLAYTFDDKNIRFVILYTPGGSFQSQFGSDAYGWLNNVALDTTNPVVIISHARLRPNDYAYSYVTDYEKLNSDLADAGNVQLVIQGHYHRNQIRDRDPGPWEYWECHSDIVYFYCRGSVLGADDGDSSDTATVADSSYYLFDINTDAYMGTNQMRANVEVTAYRKGKDKPIDKFLLC